jgi:molybdopterin converting factor small subunit
VRGQKNDPYTKSLEELEKFFNDKKNDDSSEVEFEKAKKDFEYIAHFTKRIKFPSDVREATKKTKIFVKPHVKKEVDPFKRQFGQILQYLEEREWRIVYNNFLAKKFNPAHKSEIGLESYYLPFVSGADLFTVVLPDNRTVKLALQEENIRKFLFPEDRPHVTILSLEDIGTF